MMQRALQRVQKGVKFNLHLSNQQATYLASNTRDILRKNTATMIVILL